MEGAFSLAPRDQLPMIGAFIFITTIRPVGHVLAVMQWQRGWLRDGWVAATMEVCIRSHDIDLRAV